MCGAGGCSAHSKTATCQGIPLRRTDGKQAHACALMGKRGQGQLFSASREQFSPSRAGPQFPEAESGGISSLISSGFEGTPVYRCFPQTNLEFSGFPAPHPDLPHALSTPNPSAVTPFHPHKHPLHCLISMFFPVVEQGLWGGSKSCWTLVSGRALG